MKTSLKSPRVQVYAVAVLVGLFLGRAPAFASTEGGLVVQLSLYSDVMLVGVPIYGKVTLTNRSSRPISIDAEIDPRASLYVESDLETRSGNGTWSRCDRSVTSEDERPSPAVVEIKPGESITLDSPYQSICYGKFPPGRHELRYVYRSSAGAQALGATKGEVISNIAVFRVTEPTGEDAAYLGEEARKGWDAGFLTHPTSTYAADRIWSAARGRLPRQDAPLSDAERSELRVLESFMKAGKPFVFRDRLRARQAALLVKDGRREEARSIARSLRSSSDAVARENAASLER